MYPKLILRNVFRNLQTYTIYFFSLTLIYSLLYAFNALPAKFIRSKGNVNDGDEPVHGLAFLSDSIGDCLSRRLFHKLCPGTAQERAGTLCNVGNEEEADYPYPVL